MEVARGRVEDHEPRTERAEALPCKRSKEISPFLWFDGRAEEATNFYVSIFKNSKVVSLARLQRADERG